MNAPDHTERLRRASQAIGALTARLEQVETARTEPIIQARLPCANIGIMPRA